jgi:hypothetical protein
MYQCKPTPRYMYVDLDFHYKFCMFCMTYYYDYEFHRDYAYTFLSDFAIYQKWNTAPLFWPSGLFYRPKISLLDLTSLYE